MSQALADLLIDLADPTNLEKFNEDPAAVMAAANLTEIDKAALLSRKGGWIRYQAKEAARDLAELVAHENDHTAINVNVEIMDMVDVTIDALFVFVDEGAGCVDV